MAPTELNRLITLVLYGWLVTVLLICAVTDLQRHRIPNILTYPTVLTAMAAYCFIAGWEGLLYSFGGLAIGFAVFLLPYILGGMGAGDVKLMSAVGAVLGFKQTVVCFLFIALCGGIMALAFMVYRRNLKDTLLKTFLAIFYLGMHRDASLLKVDKDTITREGIPYGVAITGGVFLFFSYLVITRDTFVAFQIF